MKATCHREGLLAALQVASGVVPQRSPRPILRQVKLSLTEDSRAILLATDLEVGIRYLVSGMSFDEPAELVLPTSEVMAILRELTDETVELTAGAGGIRLAGQSSRFELSAEDPLQFPDIPDFGDEPGHKIKSGVLSHLIRRTAFACAAENSRYALHSVLVEIEEGEIRLVATDGKRLALMAGAIEVQGAVPEGNTLLPPKALQLLARVMQDPDEDVQILLRENEALFRTSKVTVYTRLVEGRFPRYQDVIPSEIKSTVPLQVGQFHSVVRQSKIVTSDESRGVDFRFGEGELTLTSRASDVGESEVKLPIGYSGESIELTYDPQLLIDALKVLDPEEEITLELADSRRASVFRTRDGYVYVVMPLTKER